MVTESGSRGIYFQVDDAFPAGAAGLETIDVREEAKALRFISTPKKMEAFTDTYQAQFRPFTLTGSGDFHHLSALWTLQYSDTFLLLSFDNHPDWVTTGPKWSCGAWINRALENRQVRGVSIWGCGNDECDPSERVRGNQRAAEAGKLAVHPWRKAKMKYPHWLLPTTPETWRAEFAEWVGRHPGEKIYITIDMDCLTKADAVTNWEAGQFTVDDLVWALGVLHEKMYVIGGDLCGAWSKPAFAGAFQRFASWWDHPKKKIDTSRREAVNQAALARLWPALTGGH
jgi:arginase family enzyme